MRTALRSPQLFVANHAEPGLTLQEKRRYRGSTDCLGELNLLILSQNMEAHEHCQAFSYREVHVILASVATSDPKIYVWTRSRIVDDPSPTLPTPPKVPNQVPNQDVRPRPRPTQPPPPPRIEDNTAGVIVLLVLISVGIKWYWSIDAVSASMNVKNLSELTVIVSAIRDWRHQERLWLLRRDRASYRRQKSL